MRSAIDRLVENTEIEIKLIVIKNRRQQKVENNGRVKSLTELSAWDIYQAYRRRKSTIPGKSSCDLSEICWASNTRKIRTTPVPAEGLGNEITEETVNEIKDQDIAIRFGFGILKGDVLTAPKYGILSYHGGNLTKYRGRPAGFWEFMEGESKVGITVQRLSETLDGGEIIAFDTVDIQNVTSWPEIQHQIFSQMPDMLSVAVNNLEDPRFETHKPTELGEIYTNPKSQQMVKYIWKVLYLRYKYLIAGG
jgi:methionyl-tRNA formyltransferase